MGGGGGGGGGRGEKAKKKHREMIISLIPASERQCLSATMPTSKTVDLQ